MQVGRVPYFPGPHPHDPIAVVAAKDFPLFSIKKCLVTVEFEFFVEKIF